MLKKLFFTTVLCLLPSAAFAQEARNYSTIQIYPSRQPNGLIQIQTTESWNDGAAFNMVFLTIKDFSCKDRIGTITTVSGNIGIEAFSQIVNEKRQFLPDNKYGEAIAPLCQN